MKTPFTKFILGLFIFSLTLGVAAIILAQILPDKYLSPGLPLMFPFFLLLTLAVFYVVTSETGKFFSNFVNRFMLATFCKMFLSIIVLLAYVFTHREDAVPFIISFFLLYVLFSIYEAIALLKYPYHGKK
ncbi:MAG: hypothetical protein V1904_05350 [Bacteroidota bacterium]